MKYFLIYLLIINALAFALMYMDKQKAKKHAWRIPEVILFGAAVIGGSIGIMAGMELFRHKTRHRRFSIGVPIIAIVQAALAVFLFLRR